MLILNFMSTIGLIISNKYIFKTFNVNPIRLVWFHQLATSLCRIITNNLGIFKLKKIDIFRIVPLALCFCGFVIFPNLSLKVNTVGTYQIIKCLSDPLTVLVQSVFFGVHYSNKIKISLLPMVMGVVVNSVYDFRLTSLGMIYGMAGVVCTSFYGIFVGKMQKDLDVNSLQLLFYLAPVTSSMMGSVLVFGDVFLLTGDKFSFLDWKDLFRNSDLVTGGMVGFLMATGLSAYLVNYTSFWIIGNTSIITYAVFSKLKLCATILSGPYIFGDELNFQQIQGILLTLVGVFYYTYVKLHEKAKLPVVLPTSRRNSGQANKSLKLKTRLASSVGAK